MVDLEAGWQTERLDLEPLIAEHAAELAPALDDLSLHEFTGGTPLSASALTTRYRHLATRRSPDGEQLWGNWALRSRETGTAVGTVQATLPTRGPGAGQAEIAWVVATAAQSHGYAKEAARSLADRLCESGWSVAAYIHPRHVASQHVARAARMVPTDATRDGEQRWIRAPAASAP
ncbi:MAG TPA: GNAT family N-acetyltransferase [Streptosporangiaceae bacterium]|nr:GNAT family N-acetyltransferase [Streptosporangiaceae bacterium]